MKFTATTLNRSRPMHGSVVLVLLVFLTLMGMLCAATWQAVYSTRQEMALIEKHQVQRITGSTNTPPRSAQSQPAP
jgi:cytoskeletal protein RodZ